GGLRQTLANSNQHAVPHDIGVPGFWLAGDTTWPGLGTVACVLGSRIVAEGVRAAATTLARLDLPVRTVATSQRAPRNRNEAPISEAAMLSIGVQSGSDCP